MKNIKIKCKGISNISVGQYEMTIELEDISPAFIQDIETKHLVYYCENIEQFLEEIDDELVDLGIIKDGELRVPVFVTDLRLAYNFREMGLPVDVYLNIKNLTNYNFIELIGNLSPIRNYSLGFNWVID